jgi:AAA family ATP:ADP antiporter
MADMASYTLFSTATTPYAKAKLLLMTCLMFCILFNYSLVYSLRDSLVIPGLGPEVYSFLEFWIVLPAALIFTFVYIKVANLFRRQELLFHMLTGIFLAFFLLFAFVLYPHCNAITPDEASINAWTVHFPHLKWFILILSKWPFALFCVFAELWANVMMAFLFWQLANRITTIEEAKEIYPIFSIVGNLSLIGAGTALQYVVLDRTMETLVHYILLLVTLLGLISMGLYHAIFALVRRHPHLVPPETKHFPHHKPSFRESIALIFRSRYLWLMAIMVICYGITINITQATWKSQAVAYYSTPQAYAAFTGEYQRCMGLASIVFMVLGAWMMRRFRWYACAITPVIIMSICGTLFFAWVVFAKQIHALFPTWNILYMTVIAGMITVTFSKGVKFSIFDATKEMAYIPLSDELKNKGKSAVDVLGERIGKSGGALIQSLCFTIFPTITYHDLAPYFLVLFIVAMAAWFYAVSRLSTDYTALQQQINS